MPEDWFVQNAPAPDPGGGDWFAANAPSEKKKSTPPQTWSEKLGMKGPILGGSWNPVKAQIDVTEGAVSGLASTAFKGGDLIRRGLGMKRVIDTPEAKQLMAAPPTVAGQVGHYGEQAAEFAIPMGGVARAVAKAPVLARMAVEGTAAGGIAGMQSGGDPAITGIATGAGAAGPVIAAGAEAAMPYVAKLAPALERSAAKNYLSVLLPGSKRAVPKAEETATLMAKERPVALTQAGLLKRARAEKAAAGPAAGAAYSGEPDLVAAKIQPIRDEIQRLRARHVQVKGSSAEVNPSLGKALDGLEENLNSLQKNAAGDMAAETLDDFRDKLFRGIVDATGMVRQSAPATAKAIETGVANSIRRVLDDAYPSAKQLNDNYKLWASATTFIDDARRRTVAAKSGIVTGSSMGFGAAVQRMIPRPIRTLPNQVAGVFDSVAWNTVVGSAKQRIAEFLSQGKWSQATTLMKNPSASVAPPALASPGPASAPPTAPPPLATPGRAPMQASPTMPPPLSTPGPPPAQMPPAMAAPPQPAPPAASTAPPPLATPRPTTIQTPQGTYTILGEEGGRVGVSFKNNKGIVSEYGMSVAEVERLVAKQR